jgi:diguanylate cyclase (GGDEF)-like protein
MSKPTLDAFPCVLIVTDMDTNKLEYSNQFANELLGLDANSNYSLFDIISKASSILFESYIRPAIFSNGSCEEIQISLILNDKNKAPAVAHIKLIDSKLYWSIYVAIARDQLYQELLAAREHLESKTEKLTFLTRVDPLTNLHNRRAAIDDLTKIINQLKRKFMPVSFLTIDIDWFKKINDHLGHNRGDEVLIELSCILKQVTRTSDIVARWGGEEFLVVLYNANLEDTRAFCMRLHKEVSKVRPSADSTLSISIGVSVLQPEDLAYSDVIDKQINEADNALYEAKNSGRNKTAFYEVKRG